MKIWAIVPIKPIDTAKSRLSAVLKPHQRAELALDLLQNTLNILGGWKPLAGTLVTSADPAVWEMASHYRVEIFKEPDVPGLNESLKRATVEIDRMGAEGALVIPGDLPFLDHASLQKIIDLAGRPPLVVIAPDKNRQGTNVMLVSPTGAIPYSYGINSFNKHQEVARLTHIPTYVVDLASLAIDIDLPEDLYSIQAWRR
jgi:2-phospho-L-lactate/phosphoenolpyruvate guanylyltransferase